MPEGPRSRDIACALLVELRAVALCEDGELTVESVAEKDAATARVGAPLGVALDDQRRSGRVKPDQEPPRGGFLRRGRFRRE